MRALGYAGFLLALGIQSPLLYSAFENGIDYAPGRTGLLSTWATLVVLLDGLILVWWTRTRLSKSSEAIFPLAIALVGIVAAAPVALVLRIFIVRFFYT